MITRKELALLAATALWPMLEEHDKEGYATPKDYVEYMLKQMEEDPPTAIAFDLVMGAMFQAGYDYGIRDRAA